jgi:hypothetical protein
VLAIILLDLLVAAWGLNPAIPVDFYRVQAESDLVEGLLASKRAYIPTKMEKTLKFERYFRFDTFGAEEPWAQMRLYRLPNLGMLEGKALVNNFDPFVPGRYQSWITHLNSLRMDEVLDLLAWMNVDQVLVKDEQAPGSLVWQSLPGGNRLHWRVCAEYAPDEQAAWQRVTQRAFDWKRLVVLEGEDISATGNCSVAEQANQVSLTWEFTGNPNHIRARVHTTDQGWLVLADTWYPGWQVRLDGSAAERLRANYLFQAVTVPSGEHIVELFYRPLSFWLGLSLSLVSLGIVTGLGLWSRRKDG